MKSIGQRADHFYAKQIRLISAIKKVVNRLTDQFSINLKDLIRDTDEYGTKVAPDQPA